MRIFALVLFVIFSIPAILNLYAGWYQPRPVKIGANEHFSCGILLGGFGSVDAGGDGYFNSASDRFLEAVRLYKLGKIEHILISGGNSKRNDKNFTEAQWAKQQMIDFGVPDSVIFIEDRANNTRDNAKNSAEILKEDRLQPPYLLISSAYHLPRAMRQFEKNGVDVISYPTNYTDGRGRLQVVDFVPSLSTLLGWEKYIKEAVGMAIGK